MNNEEILLLKVWWTTSQIFCPRCLSLRGPKIVDSRLNRFFHTRYRSNLFSESFYIQIYVSNQCGNNFDRKYWKKKSLGKCHNSVPMTHSNFWKTFKLHFVHTYSLFMYEFLLLRQKKRVMLHQIEISWHLKTYRFHIMKTVAAISLTWKFSRDLFSKIQYLRTISTKNY